MSSYERYNNRQHNNNRNIRINEQDVPESKHTIFVRGLPGDLTTDEVKDYIEERIGAITFDFVKVSQDRTKLFVAVRFESRDDAKEFMNEYSERDFMGNRCQLTWFRDIRRFCAYQQKTVPRRVSPRRRRRSDSEDSRRSSPPVRSRSRSRSRSASKNSQRSKSRSVSSRESSRERRSRTPERRRIGNENEVRRSGRKSPKKRPRSETSESDGEWRSDDGDSRRKKQKDESSLRTSPISDHSRTPSPKGSKKKEKRETTSSIPLPPKPPQSPSVPPPSAPKFEAPPPSKAPRSPSPMNFVPLPTQKKEDNLIVGKPPMLNKEIKIMLKPESSPILTTAAQAVQNTRFSVGLEDEFTPPKIILKSDVAPPPIPPQFNANTPNRDGSLPPPPAPPPISVKSEYPSNGFQPLKSPNNDSNKNGVSKSAHPVTQKLFGQLKDFQSQLLTSVKYVKPEQEATPTFGGLRLSSMCDEEDLEEEKKTKREQKLASLTDEQMLRFVAKKKQFEAAYRGDCETYTIVTRALLSKDESLETSLKVALLENIDDLYKKLMGRVDDFLDTII